LKTSTTPRESPMDKTENRSARIAQLLGMPHGTATNRLRKNILFSLLVRLKENICSVCGGEISSSTDMSIEHKQPWEGRSSELFWELSNITFSHAGCNRQHTYKGGHRKLAPDGMAWCGGHKQFLPISNFTVRQNRWNGLAYVCRDCAK
jgi:hypothetical protein